MIKCGDLIGKSYDEYHCGKVVAEALRRMGFDGASYSIPLDNEAAAEMIALHKAGAATGWRRIGEEPHHAKKEGDIATFQMTGGNTGIAVLIGGVQFLTSTDPEGVRVLDARRLPTRCLGVYRWDTR